MLVIRPKIFSSYPEILAGVSTKSGLGRVAPYFFNLSYSVGDDPEKVKRNRQMFFSSFGLNEESVAFQKQVHGDVISIPAGGGSCGDSDAMITDKKNLGLIISTADCTPLFIYEPERKIIAAIHSGWRSTELEITRKVISRMQNDFGCRPELMLAYIGPSICGKCYEVGPEFKDKFPSEYLAPAGDKFKLDLPKRNHDLLIESGLKKSNIQVSDKCTFEKKELLHSYRRDGLQSGRALGLIVMKD